MLVEAQRSSGDLSFQPGVPIFRLNATDLSQAGVSTAAAWPQTLSEQTGASPSELLRTGSREVATNVGFQTGANLRGLGSRVTLVVINGARAAPSGSAGDFTDIGHIPLSAIDHVEIVQSGLSTSYGSDAIGGIINFVLKNYSSAPETRVRIGGVTRGDPGERQLSQSWSVPWGEKGTYLSFEYYDRESLLASARGRATSNLTPWGGGDFDTLAGNPGTIIDAASGTTWAIPKGQDGKHLTAADLISGTANSYNLFQDSTLLPRQQRFSLVSSTEQRLGETDWSFWSLFSHGSFDAQASPLAMTLTVSQSNPWYVNPGSGSQVQEEYGFGSDLGPISMQGRVDSGQFVLKMAHPLFTRWSLSTDVSFALERQHDIDRNLVNFDALNQRLANGDTRLAFNPFGDGSQNSPEVVAAIRSEGRMQYNSNLLTAGIASSGPLLSNQGRSPILSLGADFRKQSLSSHVIGSVPFAATPSTNGGRWMMGLFAQGVAPILGPGVYGPGKDKLDVDLGIRAEHFSNVGNTVAPRGGIAFSPSKAVTLHGDWSKLYRPPDLPDLSETANLSAFAFLPDAQNPAGVSRVLAWAGGNPQLHPESAKSWTVDLQVNPESHPDWHFSIAYLNTVFSNQIQSVTLPLNALIDPANSWLVLLAPTPQQQAAVCAHSQFAGSALDCLNTPISAIVDVRNHNALTLQTDSIDVKGRFGWLFDFGRFNSYVDATYIFHYAQADTPTSPLLELRDTSHKPIALRLRGGASWEREGYRVSAGVSHQGGYTNTDTITRHPVSAWTVWDAALTIPVGDVWVGADRSMELMFGVQNVFNSGPPFLINARDGTTYDMENGNLGGRRASVEIKVRW